MTELERRKPVEVHIPTPLCEAQDCDRPPSADAIWHQETTSQVHLLKVCAWHVFRLRDRQLPVVFFPLDRAPGLETVVHWMQQEVERRRPKVQQYQYVHTGFYGNTGTWGGTNVGGWGYFR